MNQRRTIAERLTQRLISWRWPLLGFASIAALVAYPVSRQVQFDRSVENMFAADDPLLRPYRQLKRTFGGNEIVMAVYTDPDLFASDKSGIERLTRIRAAAERVPGVRAVLSIEQPIGDDVVGDNPLAKPIRKLFENYTHGPDGRIVVLVCMLEAESDATVSRRATIDGLQAVVDDLPDGLAPGMLTGEPVMVADGFRYIEQDGHKLGLCTLLLMAAVIAVCFRSLRWVLIPVAVVQLALLLTKATLVASGLQLSMVSSMLAAIVTVVGTATVVHVIVRFREGRAQQLSASAAMQRAGGLLAAPILWACATDAVGFASLTASDVGPVRDFGVMMAIGSLMVLPAAALLIPGLALIGGRGTDPRSAWGEEQLGAGLSRLSSAAQRYPKTIGAAMLLATALAVVGVSRLRIETDFTKNFRASSPIVRSYQFVEQELGGAGVFDVILPAPSNLNYAYLSGVQRMEQRLRDEVVVLDASGRDVPGLTKVLSLSDVILRGSSLDLDGVPPILRRRLVSVGLSKMKERIPAFYDALYGIDPASNQPFFRIMLRSRERQPADQKQRVIEQVERIVREELPATETRPAVEVTGYFVLLTNLISSLIRDQWTTFAIASVGIFLMMSVAFRNLFYALAAVIPNALPIVVVLGLMGWLGLRMNMGAAMIAAVSVGLSVDSSIHYVAFYRRALAAHGCVAEALEEVQQTVGRAVVFSTFALVVGFLTLCTSEFVPTIYFGALVSLAMLGGLLGNLVLLPLLLAACSPRGRQRSEPPPPALADEKSASNETAADQDGGQDGDQESNP